MIPPLDERGLLPPGCHRCKDWGELEERFAFNPHRLRLLGQAMQFVRHRLTPLAGGLRLLIAGSYLSDKAQPGDVEMLVSLPLARAAMHAGLLNMFSQEGGKGSIWTNHKVDFYVQLEGLGGNDLTLFFQYVGEKTAADKGLEAKDKRGTIEIESWTLP